MFFQATPQNLPEISFEMIMEFLDDSGCFSSGEFKGKKAARSARAEYGDKAIGYVEVMREGDKCTVRGKITPEHRVRTKAYTVSAVLDEKEKIINSARCHDCAASEGGCKHAIAFIFWLHHRTIEPAPTSVTSYWRKSTLARVGSTTTYTLDQFCGEKKLKLPSCEEGTYVNYLKGMLAEGGVQNNMLMMNENNVDCTWKMLSLHCLKKRFEEISSGGAEEFLNYCSTVMTEKLCSEAKAITIEQRRSNAWFELRYGRVTASTIHNCAQCRTSGGSLVERILGAGVPIDTTAMKRGRDLEPLVLQEVQRQLGTPIKKSGLVLRHDFPFLGASPDGEGADFCVEVKCPSKSINNYLLPNGTVKPLHESQLQLQMHLMNFKKGLFVVAEPNFEKNNQINLNWLSYNPVQVKTLIDKARLFWDREIFPLL